MSDLGRKDFSTKAKEELVSLPLPTMYNTHRQTVMTNIIKTQTPDHSKSAAQRVKEGVTDTTDRAAAGVNPDSNKSTTQEAFDKTRREKDHQTNDGPIDKVCSCM